MDLWIESCERFYNTFKNDFVKRLDAVNELKVRCDKVHFTNEFLEEGRFISTDKYLERELDSLMCFCRNAFYEIYREY